VEPGVTSGDYLHGFYLGTRAALYEKGRTSVTIELPDVGPGTIGALIALFERAVGLYAFMVGINAYHQPGVEAGKKAATAVLDLQARLATTMAGRPGEALNAEEWAAALGAPAEAETVFHVLKHLAANPGRGVRRGGTPDPKGSLFSRG
jgi:glucose-6-phosphate isomerase